MLIMILKMTAVTALYVLLTMLLWLKLRKRKKLSLPIRMLIGVIYGLCSVMSTHFGVEYSHMALNVRDIGPLAAGLFFDPISGIIAGLIGGIERYIAGTLWGVGSYTRIACSVSTCLAGFLSAGLSVWLFKRKKPSVMYAVIMGAVMEVFHMYVVLVTHRSDMSMALYVVKTCAPPMIVFTGLGLGASALLLMVLAGEWKNPFRHLVAEERRVSEKFQFWLFIVIVSVLLFNQVFSYQLQGQISKQNAMNTITNLTEDICKTYDITLENMEILNQYPEKVALSEAKAVAAVMENAGTSGGVPEEELAELCSLLGFKGFLLTDSTGSTVRQTGKIGHVPDETDGIRTDSDGTINVAVPCLDGTLVASTDPAAFSGKLDEDSMHDVISHFHVGKSGTFDVVTRRGEVMLGSHLGEELSEADAELLRNAKKDVFFDATLFGEKSFCRLENLGMGVSLLVLLPYSEIYEERDANLYEQIFSNIQLFAVIYVLITLLVQHIVVENLSKVNRSLARITGGDLNEVVEVKSSQEFASLSRDINLTVDTLKGYIRAAEKRIQEEVEFARTIQESALPNHFSFPRSDFEIFATMDPAKSVGGDFYDFFFIDQNKLAMVIADVSGKGIPASLFMMRSKAALRGFAESGHSPGEILSRANDSLSEGNAADMFVTVWLGIVDLKTGLLTCANAGHEYPVLMRSGGKFEVYKDRHGLALAAMEGVRYKEYEIQLSPGDRLFVYTDGIPEAINEKTKQYGMELLLGALNRVKDRKLEEILPKVRADIAAFAGKAEQFDDITMLGFTYLGSENGGTKSDPESES